MPARSIVIVAIASLIALAAAPARANDGVPPEIFELVQTGQDVTVTVGIVEPGGEPGIGQAFDLIRSTAEGAELVLDAVTFDAAQGVPRDPWCRLQDWWGDNGPEEECALHPEYCEDCDGDAAAECPSGSPDFNAFCAAYLTYQILDECVPPGEAIYIFETPDNDSEYMRAEGSLEVTDSGATCEAAAEDCAVAAPGASGGSPALLALFCGLVGLTVLRARRKD